MSLRHELAVERGGRARRTVLDTDTEYSIGHTPHVAQPPTSLPIEKEIR